MNEKESKTSRIELRLETSLLSEIDELLDGRSRSEWIRRACKEKVEYESLIRFHGQRKNERGYRDQSPQDTEIADRLFTRDKGDHDLKPIAKKYIDLDDDL